MSDDTPSLEGITGCVEKPTFGPDKKKKTWWEKIKEVWAKLNKDGKDDDDNFISPPPAHIGDTMGANVSI